MKPIVTLDEPKDGFQEINMVYFENVEVPKANLVGEEGKVGLAPSTSWSLSGVTYSPALRAWLI